MSKLYFLSLALLWSSLSFSQYCNFTGDCGGDWINSVAIDEYVNISNVCDGYIDYTGEVEMYVAPNSTFTLAVSWETFTDGAVSVFIDWDESGTWEPVTEQTVLTAGNGTEASAPVLVPLTATPGSRVKMRVMLGNVLDVIDPCTGSTVGLLPVSEVEDYTIQVTGDVVLCATNPSPLNDTTGLCQQGIELSWNSSPFGLDPTGYKVSLGTDNPPTNLINSFDVGADSSFTIPQILDANTQYFWAVTAYDTLSEAAGCDVWNFTTSVNGDPVVELTDGANPIDSVISCLGTEANVFSTVTGGNGNLTFTWSSDDTQYLDRTDAADITHSSVVADAYNYLLTVTDVNGCFGSDSVVVNSVENPEIITNPAPIEFCPGQNIIVRSLRNAGQVQWQESTDSLSWSNVNGANQQNYIKGSPPVGIKFYRAYAFTEFCSDTSFAIKTTVHGQSSAPVITSNIAGSTFCSNESVTLYSSVTGGNVWSTGERSDSIIINEAGEFTLRFIDSNQCISAEDEASFTTLQIPEKPVIREAEAGVINICEGLIKTVSVAPTFHLVEWKGSSNFQNSFIDVRAPDTVFVKFTNGFGCSSHSDTAIAVPRPYPDVPEIFTDGNTNEFCEGTQLILRVNNDVDNVYWNGNENINTRTLAVSNPGTFIVTAETEFGCFNNSLEFKITENPAPPVPPITLLSGSTTFCKGEAAVLGTEAADDVFWNNDRGINTFTFMANESGRYFVTAETEKGCTASSASIEINVLEGPEKPMVSQIGSTLISSIQNPLFNYQWLTANGTPIPGETAFLFENAPEGNYIIRVTNPETNCSQQSDIFTDVWDHNQQDQFTVYPNPIQVGNRLTVNGDIQLSSLALYAADGRVVANQNGNSLNIIDIKPGIYILSGFRENDEILFHQRIEVRD